MAGNWYIDFAQRPGAVMAHAWRKKYAGLLPSAYSLDFNPIEDAFSKLKALLAKRPSAPSATSGPPSAASPTQATIRIKPNPL